MSRPILLCLALLATLTACTDVILTSDHKDWHSKAQVPLLHDHPFSCELVFFNVHNNKLKIEVKGVPAQCQVIRLTVDFGDKDPHDIRTHFQFVLNVNALEGKVDKELDLTAIKQDQNFEVIMYIDIESLTPQFTFNEQRKVYALFCQDNKSNYLVKLPVKTMVLTQLIGIILILLLPLNVRYRKFLPFTYNLVTVLLYIMLLFVGLYLHVVMNNSNLSYLIQKYTIGVFQLILLCLYTQDILSLCFRNNTLSLSLAIIISSAVMGIDLFGPLIEDAWFLNNFIAVMVAGAAIKFFIIRKLKTAIWALALMWAFCFVREFAIQFGWQKFQQGLGYRVIPLFIQLPVQSLDPTSTIICSAFGSSKIISFGVILNYCKRIDLSLSTHFYRFLCSAIAVLCIMMELLVNIFIMRELPATETTSVLLFYPMVVVLILFFASKRGQMAEVWHGSFYDMAVNRSYITRNISFQTLESSFGRDLLTNSDVSIEDKKKITSRSSQI